MSNRREQLVRKTKANGLPLGVIRQLNDADEESVGTTFAESDSDPAWSPVNDEKVCVCVRQSVNPISAKQKKNKLLNDIHIVLLAFMFRLTGC